MRKSCVARIIKLSPQMRRGNELSWSADDEFDSANDIACQSRDRQGAVGSPLPDGRGSDIVTDEVVVQRLLAWTVDWMPRTCSGSVSFLLKNRTEAMQSATTKADITAFSGVVVPSSSLMKLTKLLVKERIKVSPSLAG